MITAVKQWLRRRTFNPRKELREQWAALADLKSGLERVKRNLEAGVDPVRVIVQFFDVVSRCQDTGAMETIISAYTEATEPSPDGLHKMLADLSAHIKNAGRNQYGMNRTEPGEVVTTANVYLGNVDGYWTKTVQYILDSREKDFVSRMNRQADDFMHGHLGPMLNLLKNIATHPDFATN